MLLGFVYTGLHFIPLRTPGGESASHIGIFVNIRMNKLDQNQASSAGICSEQELKDDLPMRWTSPKLLETFPSSLDGEVENTMVIKEQEHSKETISDVDGNSTDLPHKRLRRIGRQEVITWSTAEIHTNPLTDNT